MKIQFKIQEFQTEAVDSVVDVFAGQPKQAGISYRIDPGAGGPEARLYSDSGLRNAPVVLSNEQILDNVREIQRRQNLPLSAELAYSLSGPNVPNLDVEMETGTGKTYVYIKTIMELNRQYGWSKFIIVVPSIAIREGVKKTFDITAEHFQDQYGTKPRVFVYNSSRLHEVEQFSSDSGVQVMIINIQAFNSRARQHRRIYEELDDFGTRRPIDVIKANNPIVIIDEPQKISAPTAQKSLSEFNALMILRYSATHKVDHVKVHRLDAVDAYNKKLVKKIGVRGINVQGLAGSTAYLYLDSIDVAAGKSPTARVEMEVRTKAGDIRRQIRRLDKGSNLHVLSNGIEAYRGLFVLDVDATKDTLELSNGDIIHAGQLADRDATEETKRRIQIREVIQAHLDKERELFGRGIKVLSLFFIDEVAKYRDYAREDTQGDYARIFEEEYQAAVREALGELALNDQMRDYLEYLQRDEVRDVHAGYFSVDKNQRAIDTKIVRTGADKGEGRDVEAYELILKDKERLLSLEEPVRFVFSHSALREGWDNPNVFVMGMLKKSDSTISRRQEVGRGLRLAVNQQGERMDSPATVHQINHLTVVTDESYTDFVEGLQKELSDSLSHRPRVASPEYFEGKTIRMPDGDRIVDTRMARHFQHHLIRAGYIDVDGYVTDHYRNDKELGLLKEPDAGEFDEVIEYLWPLVDALYLDVPVPEDDRKPERIPLNKQNFQRREFQTLWNKINHKVVYQVDFDSNELIQKCVRALDRSLTVPPLQYVVHKGEQKDDLSVRDLEVGEGFSVENLRTETETRGAPSQVKYDLIGEVAEETKLTRKTVAAILQGIHPDTFAKFKQNPEQFITNTSRLINEQKATVIVEHLTYDTLGDRYDTAIFTENQAKQDLSKVGNRLKKHVYEYAATDSQVERDFVEDLDKSSEVAVYAKLPRGFTIPTPMGDYNPDWAIAFEDGSVKHVYFVAETKGSLSSLDLRHAEDAKIESARRFFAALNEKAGEDVKYEVVTDYGDLMELVTG